MRITLESASHVALPATASHVTPPPAFAPSSGAAPVKIGGGGKIIHSFRVTASAGSGGAGGRGAAAQGAKKVLSDRLSTPLWKPTVATGHGPEHLPSADRATTSVCIDGYDLSAPPSYEKIRRRAEASMSEDIYLIVVLDVAPECLDDFKALAESLACASRAEPGTFCYDYCLDADGRTIHIIEGYKNSAALVSHIDNTIGPVFDHFKELAALQSLTVYGDPDALARERLSPLGPRYMRAFAGFLR